MIADQVVQIVQAAGLLESRGFFCALTYRTGASQDLPYKPRPHFYLAVYRTYRDYACGEPAPLFAHGGETSEAAAAALEMMRDLLNQTPTIE